MKPSASVAKWNRRTADAAVISGCAVSSASVVSPPLGETIVALTQVGHFDFRVGRGNGLTQTVASRHTHTQMERNTMAAANLPRLRGLVIRRRFHLKSGSKSYRAAV